MKSDFSNLKIVEGAQPGILFTIEHTQVQKIAADPDFLKFIGNMVEKLGGEGFQIQPDSIHPHQIHILKPLKKFGRIYTSGCFDIFHYGHLNIFEKSKALCHELIVGVSTDELIEKEKGKRPFIPYEERAKMVEAIRFVDRVIPQEDKNKQKIVDTWQIDAITVGDDWKGRYPAVSCELVYFAYTPSVSSTILKQKIVTQN